MKVKNITGTSGLTCKCDSWLTHWQNYSGKTATYCGHSTCNEKTNLVGAHVKRTDVVDSKSYILPLCKEHNKETLEFETFASYPLVSANPKDHCDK